MNKAAIPITCLTICFLTSCTSVIKKEDIILQAQEIKAAVAIPGPVEADAPQFTPLPKNEKLVYKAKYLGVTIGEFIITNLGQTMLDGRQVYCFELKVKTLAFFAKIFKTKDRYVSYMDPRDFVVLRHEEYTKGGTFLESAVDFDYEHHTASYKNFLDHREKTVPIPKKVLDMLSGGYYLRMVPWELGDTVELNIYADEKIYSYIGLLQSKTKVNLPPYGKEEAYFLKPYLFINGAAVKNISAEVFFSTAPSKKTMRAVLKTHLGSVNVVLVEGFKNPEEETLSKVQLDSGSNVPSKADLKGLFAFGELSEHRSGIEKFNRPGI